MQNEWQDQEIRSFVQRSKLLTVPLSKARAEMAPPRVLQRAATGLPLRRHCSLYVRGRASFIGCCRDRQSDPGRLSDLRSPYVHKTYQTHVKTDGVLTY